MAKNIIVWLVLAAILLSVFNSFTPQPVDNEIVYSDFVVEVQNERVTSVAIDGLIIEGVRLDGYGLQNCPSQHSGSWLDG